MGRRARGRARAAGRRPGLRVVHGAGHRPVGDGPGQPAAPRVIALAVGGIAVGSRWISRLDRPGAPREVEVSEAAEDGEPRPERITSRGSPRSNGAAARSARRRGPCRSRWR
ncbi:hypothetical protein [Clavibacter tessellarius]|uniref:hypothetical protein n=1 Tax=Clavibacter tessellarius TaxID=31965 RepID=UPI00324BE45D